MKRIHVGAIALAALAVGGSAWWFARERAPKIVRPGEAIPYDQTVQLQFPADEESDAEIWVLSKRETTREESLRGVDGSNALPEPDPAAKDHAAGESARVLDDQARAAWRGGDLDRALDLYAKAVEADPDDWLPRAHYGRLLTIMHDEARARPMLERAAALAPDDAQRWLDLQTLYERSQQFDLASEARQRATVLADGQAIVQDWAGFYTIEGSESVP